MALRYQVLGIRQQVFDVGANLARARAVLLDPIQPLTHEFTPEPEIGTPRRMTPEGNKVSGSKTFLVVQS